MSTKIEREHRLQGDERLRAHFQKAFELVKKHYPTMRATPYVKPCSRWRGSHNGTWLTDEKGHILKIGIYDVSVCLRCGRVEYGWGYVSLMGGGFFYDEIGFIDANAETIVRWTG